MATPKDPAGEIRKRIEEDLDFATDRLSTLGRQMAFGTLALAWTLVVGDEAKVVKVSRDTLLVAAAVSMLAVLFDFLQYTCAYTDSRHALRRLEAGHSGKYDRRRWAYRLRSFFFYAKLSVSFAAAGWLLAIILWAVRV
jgi:hypothetical protein